MSAFEPQLPSDPKVDMPDFMVVLRGYDRRQVELWAVEVANQIEQERLRADEAEKRAYRVQIENQGSPSFSHLGSHVASILEEAGRSSENMLADAAERAQETIDAAEEKAAEIIKAAEHRAGEIEQDARRTLDEARAEWARVEEDALEAAEEMRAQAEQDARTVLEEARDASDMIWQEAERERIGVEAETIRLETLRHRSLEQLGRVYGHLESVLDEIRAGIGPVEEEEENLEEATAAAAARLGVEPPASSPEASPRFPSIPGGDGATEARHSADEDRPQQPSLTDADDVIGPPATGASERAEPAATATEATELAPATDGPSDTAEPAAPPDLGQGETAEPAPPPDLGLGETAEPGPPSGATETTDQAPATAGPSETTGQTPAAGEAETTEVRPVAGGSGEAEGQAATGEGQSLDQDATQRLEPVGGKGRPPKTSAKDGRAKL